MKNVLIISSSPRKDSNSDLLCKEFYRGALEAGHNAEIIALREKKINYCIGCAHCAKYGRCFQDDDMPPILDKMKNADVLVFASPVYFYTMCAQLKTFIDRLYIYPHVHADTYIFVTGADKDMSLLEHAVESIRACTRDCFDKGEEKGCLIVGGVVRSGDINKREDMLQAAYKMGLEC
jgi:NAD(P)H-dependent FMN reductase